MFLSPTIQIHPIHDEIQVSSLKESVEKSEGTIGENRNAFEMYLKQSEEERSRIVNETDLRALIEVFYGLMLNFEHPSVLTNTIYLMDEFITADSNRVPLFAELEVCDFHYY